MTKTLIDIDDEQLRQAAEALGTNTKKETVAAALERAVTLARREALIDRFVSGDGYPDLSDPDIMAGAWR